MSTDLDPTTGLPLAPYQRIVIGPDATGPRRTVVDTRPGATLSSWIVRLDLPIGDGTFVTTFVDNGQPGGTYHPGQVPQQLPPIISVGYPDPTTPAPWWKWLAIGGVAIIAYWTWNNRNRWREA